MKKLNIFLWSLLSGLFVLISSSIASILFFSQESLLSTILMPGIVFGAVFLTISVFIILLIVDRIKDNAFFDTINLPILQMNTNGEMIFLNRYFKNLIRMYELDNPKSIEDLKCFAIDKQQIENILNGILLNPQSYIDFTTSIKTINNNYFKLKITEIKKNKITIMGIDETESHFLKEREDIYRNIIDAIPIPIGYGNYDGELLFLNSKLKELESKHPDDIKSPKFFENIDKVSKGEDNVFSTKIGNKIYEINQIHHANNIINFGIDKTQYYKNKKQAEQKIEFQNTLYTIQRLFISMDSENFNVNINDMLQKVLNYLKVECVYFYEVGSNSGINMYEYKKSYVPSFIEKVRKLNPYAYPEFIQRLEENNTFIVENSYNNVDSTDKFFSSIAVASDVETCLYSRSFLGIFGACTITKTKKWNEQEIVFIKMIGEMILNTIDRIKTERSLRESEETFEILTKNSPMGVVIFDLNKSERRENIYYVNSEFIETLGYTKEELDSMNIETIIDDDYQDRFKSLIDNRGQDDNRGEIKFIGRDGFVVFDIRIESIEIQSENEYSEYVLCTTINLQKNH